MKLADAIKADWVSRRFNKGKEKRFRKRASGKEVKSALDSFCQIKSGDGSYFTIILGILSFILVVAS